LDGQFSLESLLLKQTVNELSPGGMAQTLDCLAEGRGFDPRRPYPILSPFSDLDEVAPLRVWQEFCLKFEVLRGTKPTTPSTPAAFGHANPFICNEPFSAIETEPLG
jgi:hypothetical protein